MLDTEDDDRHGGDDADSDEQRPDVAASVCEHGCPDEECAGVDERLEDVGEQARGGDSVVRVVTFTELPDRMVDAVECSGPDEDRDRGKDCERDYDDDARRARRHDGAPSSVPSMARI